MGVTGQFPFFLLRRREEGPLRIPEQPLPSRVHVVMARVTWTSMIGRHGAEGDVAGEEGLHVRRRVESFFGSFCFFFLFAKN